VPIFQRHIAGLIPPIRSANEIPWSIVRVEEATTLHGEYTLADTVTIEPTEEHPDDPSPVTIEYPSELDPSYTRIRWEDEGQDVADGPLFYLGGPAEEWKPSVDQVAALVWARTKVTGGKEVGTFNENTRPTAAAAQAIIDTAVGLVAGSFTSSPCSGTLRESARRYAALYASMLIEASFYPEQTETSGSSFQAHLKLWERGVDKLAALIKVNCGGEEGEEAEEGNALPAGGFDDGLLLYGRDWPPRGGW
jgi:hypothetical protein